MIFQVLTWNSNKKEILGKRKERLYGPTYNSNEDDKAGRSSNVYYKLRVLVVNRRKKNHKYNHDK